MGNKEYSNGVLILAPPSQLNRLDEVQRWHLHELGMSDKEAFVSHNFAPPSLRRAIGILGFLHKRVLEECHPALIHALPFAPAGLLARYHSNALDPRIGEITCQDRLYQRSLYGYILVYNRLRKPIADSPSVSSFQARLTHLAKQKPQTATSCGDAVSMIAVRFRRCSILKSWDDQPNERISKTCNVTSCS